MIILAANPFIDSFVQSDWIGKIIFAGLFFLSVLCWMLLIVKVMLCQRSKREAAAFEQAFHRVRTKPLEFQCAKSDNNPLFPIYQAIKNKTLEVMNKNRHFSKGEQKAAFLSEADIDFIDAQASTSILQQVQHLERHLYLLSTIVTLAPFLGLLGTVWGILITFSGLQEHGSAGSEAVLGGLALALTTTVIGLVIAIPALVGYNYLRNKIERLRNQMEGFSSEMVASIELQYRKVS